MRFFWTFLLMLLAVHVPVEEAEARRGRSRRRINAQAVRRNVVRRPCGQGCFTRPQVQRLGAQQGSSSRAGVVRGVVDPRLGLRFVRVDEDQGSFRVVTDGQNLFERAIEKDRNGIEREVTRVLQIQNGVLLGNAYPETRIQVLDIFLKNFDKFAQAGGRQFQLVRDFINANGAGDAILGNLRVAMVGGVLPPGVSLKQRDEYKTYSDEQITSAAVSYAVNLLSNSPNVISDFKGPIGSGGVISVNMLGKVDPAGFARLMLENPYDCPDARGVRRGVVRADWFVTRALNPPLYYQTAGLSAKQDEFADQVGFIDDKLASRGGLMFVGGTREKPESIVGKNPQRVLQWQVRRNNPNRFCFRSHDFIQHPAPGKDAQSRDVFITGPEFTADGGEWICQRANGFPIFYLSQEKDKTRLDTAPADVAGFGTEPVSSPETCMKCHMNGFHGGRLKNRGFGVDAKPYTDHIEVFDKDGKLQPPRVTVGTSFFSANARYDKDGNEIKLRLGDASFNGIARDYPTAARLASEIQTNAFKEAGAYLEDPRWIIEKNGTKDIPANPYIQPRGLPVAADMADEYRKGLTPEKQAAELGTTVEAVVKLTNGPRIVSRTEFEKTFCTQLAAVRGGNFISRQSDIPPAAAHGGAAEQQARPPSQ